MYSKVIGVDAFEANNISECLADPEIHTLNVGGIYNYLLFASLNFTLSITPQISPIRALAQ